MRLPMRLDEDQLWCAWEAIRRGGKSAGPDGLTVVHFRGRQVAEIEALLRDLRTGRYAPGTYRAVQVPKESGGSRVLAIATVRDRVVQRLLHDRLLPVVERTALDCSFAYRPGRCHLDALERVAAWREAGFRHVVHADVRSCFDEINLLLVAMLMERAGVDDEVREIALECLSAGFSGRPRPDDLRGLPQGAVLSPILCNLVLTEFDRAMAGRHRRLVRFADDFVILCQSPATCERMLDRARTALADLGLAVNERKTEITSFGQGFHYLGARLVGGFIIPEKKAPYIRNQDLLGPCKRHSGLGWVF